MTSSQTAARILVVDDEVELKSVLTEMLVEHGYDATGCASAEEALVVLREREVDLVITDLMMSGLDGISLLRQAQELQPYLLGIVATGQGTIQTAVDAMRTGAFDYVLKPFKLSVLLPTLERAIEVGRLKRENARLRSAETEAQIERARRMAAEQALAIRDEFLSVAAHELKTPLTSLLGAAQLLVRQQARGITLDSRQIQRSMQIVDRQAIKLSRLVTQLLEKSRIDAGRFTPDRSTLDLVSLIGAAVGLAQAGTDRHEIVLGAPERIVAHVDPLRIEQVVTNLLDNAIKFSPDGGRIEVELSALNDATVRLVVRDYGLGIPPSRRHDLFTRYYQAHAESHRSGLGLGLYISRRIVELHGGSIAVEFPADAGTRFVVHLPTGVRGSEPALAGQPGSSEIG